MGIIESNPVIQGKSVSFKKQEEKKFFNRSHILLKDNFKKNLISDYNLIKSLEFKSFIGGVKNPDMNQIRDITWKEYLIIHINNLKDKYHASWAINLLVFLKGKNLMLSENKYFSDFFYNEYRIKTMPNIINSINEKIESNPQIDYGDICCALFKKELTLFKDEGNYCELDVLENLGGSYLEINYDELSPDDPAFHYYQRRNNVKKYIKIFKEHICDNIDHPINQVVNCFNKLFSKYILDKIKELNDQVEKEVIDQGRFDASIKAFEEEITSSLQEFISRMHSALKLFYSTTLDFKFFEEEKDDLINLVTSFFFKTGNLYEAIFELYSYSFKNEFQRFQDKLIELKSLKPKKLGIETKFCLDEETIKLQNKLRNKNNVNIDKINKNLDEINEDNKIKVENDNSSKKMKKTSLFQKISDDNKKNLLFPINEIEDEKYEANNINNINNINDINIIIGSQNINNTGQAIYYLDDEDKPYDNNNKNKTIYYDYSSPIRSKTKLSLNKKKDDYYILEKMSFLEDSRYEYNLNQSNQIRYTVNNFNNKVYLFPKLHDKLKKNINKYESTKRSLYSKNKDNNENSLPIPYFSAIKLMKSIKKYKTPFEKIILIASISDQIMESATSFWKDMEPYIEKDYLFIEADDITNIFLYIIIQSQMPEILLYSKMINNFTTQFTKSFNISYNYTLLGASMDYITGLKDIKELSQREDGFFDASKSILDISTQRISRLSIGIGQG